MSASSIRSRVRSEMSHEIKQAARARLAEDGANLSLRAVARDLGIVASALYRYFPSRDALLTALIVDAYRDLRDAAQQAVEAVPADQPRDQWLALCCAVRAWALAHPAEYGLVYGTPVPGYAAPPETVEPAAAVLLLLARIVGENSELRSPGIEPVPEAVRADLRRLIDQRAESMSEEQLDRVLLAWTHLFGAITFEVFGRMDDLIRARDEYFRRHVLLVADLVGLPG